MRRTKGNRKLFADAGLVNADGSVMVPQTYKEIAEFSKQIKEKTGAAGFVMPTIDNCGGWHFINIAKNWIDTTVRFFFFIFSVIKVKICEKI